MEGERIPVDGVDMNWRFAGSTLTTGSEAKEDSGTPVVLDARAKPATIDFTLTRFSDDRTGVLIGTDYQGIYKFEPDGRLLICYRPKSPGVLRPKRFATALHSGATIVTLQRPEPKHETPIGAEFATPVIDAKEPFPIKVSRAPKADTAVKDTDLPHILGAWELTDMDGLTPEAASQKLDQQ